MIVSISLFVAFMSTSLSPWPFSRACLLPTTGQRQSLPEFQGATTRFAYLEKFCLSSSFVIRVNLLHP